MYQWLSARLGKATLVDILGDIHTSIPDWEAAKVPVRKPYGTIPRATAPNTTACTRC